MTEDYIAIIKADECRKCNDREGTFLNIKKGLRMRWNQNGKLWR